MFLVISGTNRLGSNTLKVARQVMAQMAALDADPRLLDLLQLPTELLRPEAYGTKPPAFEPFQEDILTAEGIIIVTPEYNGSFPGILKYFIDMLRFPESLQQKPVALIGLAAGQWGGVRSVEQLGQIAQYRSAHIYGRRLFMPGINQLLGEGGQIKDEALVKRLHQLLEGFVEFARAIG